MKQHEARWPTTRDGRPLSLGEMSSTQRELVVKAALARLADELRDTEGVSLDIVMERTSLRA